VDKNGTKLFTKAKQILTSIYGERKEEMLQKLLDGATLQGKPSVILEEIKRLCIALGVSESQGFVKGIWLKRLSPYTRGIIGSPLYDTWGIEDLAKSADVMEHAMNTMQQAGNKDASVCA